LAFSGVITGHPLESPPLLPQLPDDLKAGESAAVKIDLAWDELRQEDRTSFFALIKAALPRCGSTFRRPIEGWVSSKEQEVLRLSHLPKPMVSNRVLVQPTPQSSSLRALHTTTILTSDFEARGSLSFAGQLELHGRFEGTIETENGVLSIGEQALVSGEIRASDILVYGKVRGNIYATGRLEIRGKAEVYGDIFANRVAMDDGVIFVGRSHTLVSQAEPKFFKWTIMGKGTVREVTETSSKSAQHA
jgi:cytoskeletal protein CcmA (bactofilin family)